MEDYLILRNVSMFRDLDDADLRTFAAIVSESLYRKGEVIFHSNDKGSCLFILRSGLVKISIFDGKGKEDILKIVYPYDCFGEMSLLDGFHRSATVIAMEESRALLVPRDQFIELIALHPKVALGMLAMLSRRLRKTDEKIASLRFADAYGKVARILLDLARNRGVLDGGGDGGGNGGGNRRVVDFDLTRDTLGGLAGVTRETVTRILKEFQVHGCIKVDGRKITIVDAAVLEREACQ